jgi:hypothetical protein
MSRTKGHGPKIPTTKKAAAPPQAQKVASLLDAMSDGNEYQSIVSLIPEDGELIPDLKRAISDLEKIRGNPCLCYIANVVNSKVKNIEIDFSDDLPFKEMIQVAPKVDEIDVVIVTPGGITQQVPQFVNAIRKKYKKVNFIIPYMCMSAGSLFVLSGDSIWMDSRGFIGPVDPQVRGKTGEYIPAQSLLKILEIIKQEGEKQLENGAGVPWHYVRLLDTMDHRQIGNAFTTSEYVQRMASEFLLTYKFKHWDKREATGEIVTHDYKQARADQIAEKLSTNDYWKSHSHGIDRETVKRELELKVSDIESEKGLERSVRRLWALFYYTLERSKIRKIFMSSNYILIRLVPEGENHE